ncbi:hypothetical protein MRS44_003823 [Fusarium solani]|uniref:uncharacterized protein n=1 Tax=Fusarium solani TaxID=169388 RepID=UPI0032C3E532|nr:hypothetical protein MRS44_003823 [Fusarium solani]
MNPRGIPVLVLLSSYVAAQDPGNDGQSRVTNEVRLQSAAVETIVPLTTSPPDSVGTIKRNIIDDLMSSARAAGDEFSNELGSQLSNGQTWVEKKVSDAVTAIGSAETWAATKGGSLSSALESAKAGLPTSILDEINGGNNDEEKVSSAASGSSGGWIGTMIVGLALGATAIMHGIA